jgi:predicted RNase H-like nuclease (RuvC/YqgF family)
MTASNDGNIFTEDIGLDTDDTDEVEGTDSQEESQETEEADGDNAEGAEETEEAEEFDAERAKEALRKKNSEARNLRKQKKALEAEVAALKKGSTAGDDDLEAVRAENEKLRREVSLSKREAIARKHGLPDSFADRLMGDDEDEWEEDAEALAADLKPTRKPGRTKNPGASAGEKKVQVSKADQFFDGLPTF